ncbi:hypothetical protein HDU76_008892, partial [Blyttiomyces sp. JEL0837]
MGFKESFLKWKRKDDIARAISSSHQHNFDVGGGIEERVVVDYWKFLDPFRRSVDLSLMDNGALELALEKKSKEDEEAAKAAEASAAAALSAQNAATAVENAAKPLSVPAAGSNSMTLEMPSVPANQTDLISPKLNSAMDLGDLALGGLSLPMNDAFDMDLDDFGVKDSIIDDFFSSTTPPSMTTPGPNGISLAPSPAFSLPTVSPSPFHAPATPAPIPFSSSSPAPFTPSYSANLGAIANSSCSPQPTSPQFVPEEHKPSPSSLSTDCQTPAPSHSSIVQTPGVIIPHEAFEVSSIDNTFKEPNSLPDNSAFVPEEWRSLTLAYDIVWKASES